MRPATGTNSDTTTKHHSTKHQPRFSRPREAATNFFEPFSGTRIAVNVSSARDVARTTVAVSSQRDSQSLYRHNVTHCRCLVTTLLTVAVSSQSYSVSLSRYNVTHSRCLVTTLLTVAVSSRYSLSLSRTCCTLDRIFRSRSEKKFNAAKTVCTIFAKFSVPVPLSILHVV